MNFRDSAARCIATGCFVGNFPFAPGTVGTLLGLPVCLLFARMGFGAAVVGNILLIALAVWAAGETEKRLEKKDPGCIVIDEVAGMAVTLLGLPFTLNTAVAGFLVFRFFDIVKPPPVRQLDRHVSGGLGVVLDDVAAGILGNIVLRLVFFTTGI